MAPFINLNGQTVEYPEIGRYQERYVDGQKEVSRFFIIDWAEQNNFAQVMLGSARVPTVFVPNDSWTPIENVLPTGIYTPVEPPALNIGNFGITRRLPAADPSYPECFADSVDLIDVEGAHIAGFKSGAPGPPIASSLLMADNSAAISAGGFTFDAVTGKPQFPLGKCVMNVIFRKPLYDVLPDYPVNPPLANTPHIKENLRFVSWEAQYSGEAVQNLARRFYFISLGGLFNVFNLIPEASVKLLSFANLKITWWKVPQPTLPLVVYYGRTNSTNLQFGTANPFRSGQQQLVFLGAQASPLMTFPDGLPYRNYELSFVFRPQGWNRIFRPTTGLFHPVSANGVAGLPNVEGNYPYLPSDLSRIFTYP